MDAQAMLNRAADSIRQGKHAEAVAQCQAILKKSPRNVEAMGLLGTAYLGAKRQDDAKKWVRKALALRPGDEMSSFNMATIQLREGQADAALRTITAATRARPSSVKLQALRAQVLNSVGRREDALTLTAALIEQGVVDPLVAREFATAGARLGKGDQAIAYLRVCLGSNAIGASSKPGLWRHLGRMLDRTQCYDEAFDAFERGHALERGGFDADAFEARIERAIATWTPESVASRRAWGDASDRPLLILGMPRSGTSLVEQILASHPDVTACGELHNLLRAAGNLGKLLTGTSPVLDDPSLLEPRGVGAAAREYVRRLGQASPKAVRATDKMPLNFLVLGLAAIMVPNARVVHCVRDPRDVCLSCYMQDFTGSMPFTHDLGHLGRYHRAHDRLMEHWRRVLELPIMEVQYEDMVADQEATTRALVAFAGLPWDDRCLAFHESRRSVVTASYEQVRNPIYATSVERWRRYEHRLGPLLDALQK